VRSDAFLATRQNNSYTFNGQFSRDGFADFLLGIPSSSSLALKPNDPARFRRTQMAYYILDDWKVNSKLTLNIGLRYEFNEVPKELSGLTPIFDPTLGNGTGGLLYPSQNTNAKAFQDIRPDLFVRLPDVKPNTCRTRTTLPLGLALPSARLTAIGR
jgi:outer membrane receptor protein involved in Fe transport